jgi:hypothetical protein
VSDFELFDVGQAELRPQMMLESIDAILTLWTQDPPYEIDGRFWKISVKPEFKVGYPGQDALIMSVGLTRAAPRCSIGSRANSIPFGNLMPVNLMEVDHAATHR